MTVDDRVTEALKIRETDKHEYLDELLDIDREFPDNGQVLRLIAHTKWEVEDYKGAIEIAQRLIEDSSEDESVSLILFHSLWATNRPQDAIREMERYQDLSSSDDYAQFDKWVRAWGAKRAGHNFADLEAIGESTKVVMEGLPEGANEEEFEG